MKSSILILLLISTLFAAYGIIDLIFMNVAYPFWKKDKIVSTYEMVILVFTTIHVLYVIVLSFFVVRDSESVDADVFLVAMIPFLSPGVLLGIPFAIMGWLASKGKQNQFGRE